MPRLSDALVKTIVYLYSSVEDAQSDSPRTGGTGFLVSVPYSHRIDDTQNFHVYIVTDAHVLDGGIGAVRLNGLDGSATIEICPQEQWKRHPDGDDLAALAVQINFALYDQLHLPIDYFITPQFVNALDIGMGDEVFMLGRFSYHEGRKLNLPTARFGYIAQLPKEPIKVKRSSGWTTYQEGFLVEMRSISGYSGSPVFVYVPEGRPNLNSSSEAFRLTPEFHLKLLGVDLGHLPKLEPIIDSSGSRIAQYRTEGNAAMTTVIPAWKLKELLLETDEFKQQRKRDEEAAINAMGEGGIVLDSAPDEIHDELSSKSDSEEDK